MLDLKRLRIFHEVASRRSFSAAADALNYSQPAVSHHVSRLEAEVGTRLLDRSGHGVSLTEAGEVLFDHAEALLTASASAEAAVADVVGPSDRTVRLGAFATACATFVADAIGGFRDAEPDVQLSLLEGEPSDTIEALKTRAIDLAVVYGDAARSLSPDRYLEERPLGDDPMLVALPVSHRLSGRTVVELSDLADESWIEDAADAPTSLLLRAACQEVGFEPRIAFNSSDYRVVQRLTAVGMGIALVPLLALTRPDPQIVVRAVIPRTPVRRVSLLLRRGEPRGHALSEMQTQLERAWEARTMSPPEGIEAFDSRTQDLSWTGA